MWGSLFWVSYNSQLQEFFFLQLDCLIQGNTRSISTKKKCTCGPSLLAVIGIYLNRFDWIDRREINLEFLWKTWIVVVFTQLFSSNRLESKYICNFFVLDLIIFCPVVLHSAVVIYSRRRDSHRQNSRLPTVCTQR